MVGVVKRADGGPLTEADVQRVQQLTAELAGAGIDRVAAAQTAPRAVSPNRTVQLVTVALQGTPQDEAVVEALRQVRERSVETLEGSGLRIGYTGDVALFADSTEAFADAERIVGIATIVLVVGLQLLIFRRRGPAAAATTPQTMVSGSSLRNRGPLPPAGQCRNPARVCANHSGSSSQG